MKSYLLIDSTYRDRLLYPNPAEFDIPFQLVNSQILNPNLFSAVNPITLPYPDYNFQWLAFGSPDGSYIISGTIVGGTASAPLLDPQINFYLSINGIKDYLYTSVQNATGIFQGLTFIYNSEMNTPFRILNYDPVTRIIFLDGEIPDFFTNSTYSIVNPSSNDLVYILGDFINRSGVVYFNTDELYLYDIAINEIRRVVRYDSSEKTFRLEPPFSEEVWQATDPYIVISEQPVINNGTIQKFRNGRFLIHQTIFKYSMHKRGGAYRRGDCLHPIAEGCEFTTDAMTFRVVHTSGSGEILDMEIIDVGVREYTINAVYKLFFTDGTLSPHPAYIIATDTISVFKVRFVDPITIGTIINNFFFPVLLSPSFLIDKNQLKIAGNSTLPLFTGDYAPIDVMNSFYANGVSGIRGCIPISSTEAYLLVQAFPSYLLDRFNYILEPVPDPLKGCTNCLILPYMREGVVGLNFTGTQLTLSQASCFRMSVITLILPNLTIDVGPGPLTSFFPYVFLEISNVSNSNGRNKSILYSNNPYTSSVTFVCSISDVNNPITTRFIKITSDGSSQTIKFTPVDTLRFRVSLPDGSTFRTEKTDYLVPVEPDPRIQLHAVLEIERL